MTQAGIEHPAGPKQDRSRETRAKLLESAVTCLAQRGWSATTVAVVAEHAGVSRGAVQHHFPTREDLVVGAIEQMAEQRVTAARRSLTPRAGERIPAGEVVRHVVELYSGELFNAALALWSAAVAEENLRDRVRRLEARVSREAHRLVVDALGADESRPGVREAIQVTLDWARGLGLANLLTDDRARRAPSVAYWGRLLESAIDAAPAPAQAPAPPQSPAGPDPEPTTGR